jgi:hypothetical protein
MIKRILSFFKKEEVKEHIIKISEAEEKAEELLKEYISKNIIPSFENITDEIKRIELEIEERCKDLEDSKLKNENILLKEKQYMEGNRKSYVKHARILLQNIMLPPNYELIEEIYPKFKELIENYAKHTMRSRQILHHFFEHETEAIHNSIASLNKQYENMKNLIDEEKYKNNLSLIKSINRLKNAKQGKKELKNEIKDNENLIIKTKQELKVLNDKLETKKKSKEYLRLEEINKNKEEYETRLNNIISDIKTKFSKFERALKKYERIAIDESAWVHAYLKDAYQAVSTDSQNKGVKVLEGLKERINNNSIELKNSDKIIAEIDNIIQKDLINNTHNEITSCNKNINNIKKELKSIIIAEEIKELNEKINSNKRIINNHERQLEELNKKYDEMPIDKYLDEVKENFSKMLDGKIIMQ